MTESISNNITPDRLLLATDLSVKCDRALDRAAQLAGEWHAEMIALNVLDPAATPDQALAWANGASEEQLLQVAREQLRRDMVGINASATLRIVRNTDPAAAIADTATRSNASIVVTGIASNETFGRFLLGSTVEQLARSLTQPLLVVRNRVSASYQRIVVASDFSEASRPALQTAAALFPDRELTVFHAYDKPLSGLSTDSPPSPDAIAQAQGEFAAWLHASALPAHARVSLVVERGPTEIALTRYVRRHAIELVALGNQGSSDIIDLLLGSTAAKLLEWLPCDILLVRPPRASP